MCIYIKYFHSEFSKININKFFIISYNTEACNIAGMYEISYSDESWCHHERVFLNANI